MNTPVTLYLADDHQIVIDGLKLLIGNEDNIRIIGSANDGATAFTDIINKKPDLALLDLRMPGMDGLELIYKLNKSIAPTKLIILSMHGNPREIKDAIVGGASGYLLKNSGKTILMDCLNAVIKGGSYFPTLPKNKPGTSRQSFTPRESEILKLVLEGQTSGDIADQLCLSRLTVDVHRKNICRKAGTTTPLGLKKFVDDNRIEL